MQKKKSQIKNVRRFISDIWIARVECLSIATEMELCLLRRSDLLRSSLYTFRDNESVAIKIQNSSSDGAVVVGSLSH